MKKISKKDNGVVNFINEIRSLQRIRRSSYQTFNADMGSIADHSYNVTMIAILLAGEVGANLQEVSLMALIHDIAESRVGDANFVHKRYQTKAETDAFIDIINPLPPNIRSIFLTHYRAFLAQKTLAAKVVKDADILDQLFQENILVEQGYTEAKKWLKYSKKQLILPQSRSLAAKAETVAATEWWTQLAGTPKLAASKRRLLRHAFLQFADPSK